MTYRGYEIDKEQDGTFSVYRFGYLCNRKTIDEAKKYIDWKVG